MIACNCVLKLFLFQIKSFAHAWLHPRNKSMLPPKTLPVRWRSEPGREVSDDDRLNHSKLSLSAEVRRDRPANHGRSTTLTLTGLTRPSSSGLVLHRGLASQLMHLPARTMSFQLKSKLIGSPIRGLLSDFSIIMPHNKRNMNCTSISLGIIHGVSKTRPLFL